jgi:flagellar hook protein FlgE
MAKATKTTKTAEEAAMAKNEKHNDGSMSGLKKTIIGTVGTLVTAGGAFLMTYMQKPKEGDTKQAAPQSININIPQQQQAASSKTVIYKEAAPAQKDLKKAENSEKPAKKKEEFKEEPKW